jgi:hypothetical protein
MTGTANKRTGLLLTVAALVAAGSGCTDSGGGERSADTPGAPAPTQTNTTPTTSAVDGAQLRLEGPPIRLSATPGLKLGRSRRAEALRTAQEFAVSLTRWLYGDRKRLEVEPLAPAAGRELAASPPYIPPDQRGTGEGRVQLLELALQTERSGIVTVTINDPRTSYRIPAALEQRGGSWQIVHLNTH